MRYLRKKGRNYNDISPDEVFVPTIGVALCIVVIGLLFCGIYAISAASHNNGMPDYNERVARFNALSEDERQLLYEWMAGDDIDEETHLMTERERMAVFLLKELHGDHLASVIPIYILVILAILSACTFGGYWYYRDSDYYLCSLPYDRPYGWVLFFCMFMGWPIMLGSFIRYLVQHSDHYQEWRRKRREAREKKRQAKKQEKAAVEQLAYDELAEVARGLTKPKFPERAHQAFVGYITSGQSESYKSVLQESAQKLADAERELQRAGERVRAAQRAVGEARAYHATISEADHARTDRARAEADWEAIKNARGISQIIYNRKRKRLEILIKVRVPYEGELYDFGDYCLYIDGGKRCNCREVRSGVKLDRTSTAPLYHIHGKDFCFGSNLDTIEGYLGSGRYVEAITLIVECMHSVNNKYDAADIPNCFRKVSVVDKAKRRILRRNKLKFWQRK